MFDDCCGQATFVASGQPLLIGKLTPLPSPQAPQRQPSAISRRNAPEVWIEWHPLKVEGAGKAGCPEHPQPVCKGSKHTVVTTVAPESPGFPRAMVLTAYFALSPATNSFCHRRPRIAGCRTRSGRRHLRRLGISNGCQNHTTSPSAVCIARLARVARSQLVRAALLNPARASIRVHRIPTRVS